MKVYLLADNDGYKFIVRGIFSTRNLAETARDQIIIDEDRVSNQKWKIREAESWQKNHEFWLEYNLKYNNRELKHQRHDWLDMSLEELAKESYSIYEIDVDNILNYDIGYSE